MRAAAAELVTGCSSASPSARRSSRSKARSRITSPRSIAITSRRRSAAADASRARAGSSSRSRTDASGWTSCSPRAGRWRRPAGSARAGRRRLAAGHARVYTEVARWAAGRGILRLAFLRLEGRAIAFELALEDNGVYAILKGGFDVELRKFGPGGLITYEQLARAFELGLRRYEFLGTDEPYKTVWTPAVHERRVLQAFAPTPLGLAERAAYAYGRPLARRLLVADPSAKRADRAAAEAAANAADSAGGVPPNFSRGRNT